MTFVHDCLDHSMDSEFTGVADELRALGAAVFTREIQDLAHDLVSIAAYSLENKLEPVSRNHQIDSRFIEFRNRAASMLADEFDNYEYLSKWDRQKLSSYLRNAVDYMQIGYEWAKEFYGSMPSYSRSRVVDSIASAYVDPDYEYQEAILHINFETQTAYIEETYEEYDDE